MAGVGGKQPLPNRVFPLAASGHTIAHSVSPEGWDELTNLWDYTELIFFQFQFNPTILLKKTTPINKLNFIFTSPSVN